MIENDKLQSVEHLWYESSDRWILMERYESGYLGLNSMQGNDYPMFKKDYTEMNRGLSEFYDTMRCDLKILRQSVAPVDFIDRVIWIYFEAKSKYDEYGH